MLDQKLISFFVFKSILPFYCQVLKSKTPFEFYKGVSKFKQANFFSSGHFFKIINIDIVYTTKNRQYATCVQCCQSVVNYNIQPVLINTTIIYSFCWRPSCTIEWKKLGSGRPSAHSKF